MRYELDVVEKNGIHYFQHTHFGVARRFEALTAFEEFEGGTLKIMREGALHAETDSIQTVPSFKAASPVTTIFSGISNVFRNKASPSYLDCLTADLFDVGDRVIIEAPKAQYDGQFARYLKRQTETVLDI
jgi:hypothetical protein